MAFITTIASGGGTGSQFSAKDSLRKPLPLPGSSVHDWRMVTQWHPLFGHLLKPGLEGYYEVHTSLPVGEAPRQADFVLVRRTASGPLPFQSLWRHLTIWNVIEFKGPTARPRREHVSALVEVGLGIARKLSAERAPKKQMPPEEIAFWYLANRLSSRYLNWLRGKVGTLEELCPGLWQTSVLGHPIRLASGADLPIDEETLPLHVVGQYDREKECAVAEFVASKDSLLAQYASFEAIYHPEAWQEVDGMAKARRRGFGINVKAVAECVGTEQLIEALGHKQVLEAMGTKQVLEAMDTKQVLEAMGTKQVLEAMDIRDIRAFLASKTVPAKSK